MRFLFFEMQISGDFTFAIFRKSVIILPRKISIRLELNESKFSKIW